MNPSKLDLLLEELWERKDEISYMNTCIQYDERSRKFETLGPIGAYGPGTNLKKCSYKTPCDFGQYVKDHMQQSAYEIVFKPNTKIDGLLNGICQLDTPLTCSFEQIKRSVSSVSKGEYSPQIEIIEKENADIRRKIVLFEKKSEELRELDPNCVIERRNLIEKCPSPEWYDTTYEYELTYSIKCGKKSKLYQMLYKNGWFETHCPGYLMEIFKTSWSRKHYQP